MSKKLVRRSATTWNDIKVLHKLSQQLQTRLLEFATGGMQESGINDDQWVIVECIQLKDRIEELIERSRVKNLDYRRQVDIEFGRIKEELTPPTSIET